jgi:glucosamine--fructose-6-phosphate aminotransferase (isomerizing)
VLHGPAELVTSGFPIIAFVPSDAARQGMLATLARLADMGAAVIAIEAGGADHADRLAVAKAEATLLEPIVMIHRFYRLAEALALRLGRDPDRPRNLHKVTETV